MLKISDVSATIQAEDSPYTKYIVHVNRLRPFGCTESSTEDSSSDVKEVEHKQPSVKDDLSNIARVPKTRVSNKKKKLNKPAPPILFFLFFTDLSIEMEDRFGNATHVGKEKGTPLRFSPVHSVKLEDSSENQKEDENHSSLD